GRCGGRAGRAAGSVRCRSRCRLPALVAPLAPSGEGPHRAVADLDVDAAQGPLRGTGAHVAGGGVEEALVAGALELTGVGLVVDDAAEVGALLREGPQLPPGEVHEDGRVGAGRVVEELGRPLRD